MIRALSYRLLGSLGVFGGIVGASVHHTPLGLSMGFAAALLGIEVALWPVAQHVGRLSAPATDEWVREAIANSHEQAVLTARGMAAKDRSGGLRVLADKVSAVQDQDSAIQDILTQLTTRLDAVETKADDASVLAAYLKLALTALEKRVDRETGDYA